MRENHFLKFSVHLYVKIFIPADQNFPEKLQTNNMENLKQVSGEIKAQLRRPKLS